MPVVGFRIQFWPQAACLVNSIMVSFGILFNSIPSEQAHNSFQVPDTSSRSYIHTRNRNGIQQSDILSFLSKIILGCGTLHFWSVLAGTIHRRQGRRCLARQSMICCLTAQRPLTRSGIPTSGTPGSPPQTGHHHVCQNLRDLCGLPAPIFVP